MQNVMAQGHTEEKHVTSKTKLRRRLYGCNLNAVSSYFTCEDAEKMISQVVHKNQDKIENWLMKPMEKLVLYGESLEPVGFGYFIEKENVIFDSNLKKACVVLKKEEDTFEVLTSYLLR